MFARIDRASNKFGRAFLSSWHGSLSLFALETSSIGFIILGIYTLAKGR